jgi:RNA polymerase sigma factor (sigma-70 family)
MARTSIGPLLRHLRKVLDPAHGANVGDDELLERFVRQRDETAFELLVWRHQRMVLAVCRRVLGNAHDVEDAFQATFLTLARKAESLRRHPAVAGWLHRVAYHIALRARKNAAQRKTVDLDPADLVSLCNPAEEAMRRDLAAVLDAEVSRLPDKYRVPVVLCYLEGRTYQEVSAQLGVPLGTLSARLTRARDLLRARLLRRGVVVSSAGLSSALLPDALASAGMARWIGSLVRAAAAVVADGVAPAGLMSARTLALTEGMLRMMFMTKVKMVAAFSIVVALAAAGLATLSHATRAADEPLALTEPPHKDAPARSSEKPSKESPSVANDTLEQQDGIAWGKAAHGLQAGIGFRPGDQTTYEVGQSVTFVVYLRNVNDKTIRVSHIEQWFNERPPQVEDTKGRRLAVAIGTIHLGDVPIVHRNLEAGEQITLGYPWFRIQPLGWRGEVLGPTCCAEPGQYKVGCMGLVLRLDDGQDISLGTKTVELNIGKSKGETADHSRRSVDSLLKPSSWDDEGKPNMARRILPEEATTSVASPRVFYVSSRSLKIPVRVDPESRDQIAGISLLVSEDNGETWEQIDIQPATAKHFDFKAPRDGTYWFIVQTLDRQGRLAPENLNRVMPSLGVCVDTTPPVASLIANGRRILGLTLVDMHMSWTVSDANLDGGTLALEWAEKSKGPWHSIGTGATISSNHQRSRECTMTLPEYLPKRIHVRLRVKDKAGNETIDVQSVDIKTGAPTYAQP